MRQLPTYCIHIRTLIYTHTGKLPAVDSTDWYRSVLNGPTSYPQWPLSIYLKVTRRRQATCHGDWTANELWKHVLCNLCSFFFGVYFPSVPYLFLGFFFQTFRPFNGPYFCSSFKGLFHRPNHQRQHQLLPHVQEDVPAPSRDDGRQSRCSSRPRRLGATVCWILLECFAAHVSNTEAHIIIHAQTYTLIRVLTQEL